MNLTQTLGTKIVDLAATFNKDGYALCDSLRGTSFCADLSIAVNLILAFLNEHDLMGDPN